MGYRPHPPTLGQPPRCWHDPLPVRTVITEELVGHICSKCLEVCDARPVPPSHRDLSLIAQYMSAPKQ